MGATRPAGRVGCAELSVGTARTGVQQEAALIQPTIPCWSKTPRPQSPEAPAPRARTSPRRRSYAATKGQPEANQRISSFAARVFFSPSPESALDAARMDFDTEALTQTCGEILCP